MNSEATETLGSAVGSGKKVSSTRSRGTSSRCPKCKLSIKIPGNVSPPVCPFCQGRMETSVYEVAPATAEPAGVVDERGRSSVEYNPPRTLFGVTVAILSIFLLAVAVYLKLHNTIYFWYQPWINTYSILVGIFILSRFLIAAFYVPPPDEGYTPNVSVVVACMNEEGSIERTIGRIFNEGYPRDKLEVIVVNDGSSDNTLEEMMNAQGRHRNLVVADFEENKGKRHGMAIGGFWRGARFWSMSIPTVFCSRARYIRWYRDSQIRPWPGFRDIPMLKMFAGTSSPGCRMSAITSPTGS